MTDASDMELLRDYDRHGSEAAFATVVQRHIHLVYSVALRHTGIAAHAEEITQAVFIILARKAAGLRADTILESWLHETTRLTALSFLRGERRRQAREQEAYMQSTLPTDNDDALWNQLAPTLDGAVSRLGKKDRDAVMLRFFKDQNLREVAAALNVNEAAAQRRVHRAVEKLRGYFSKRGVTLTATVLTAALAANSVTAAPLGLAATVTATAVKGAVVSGSTLTLIKGALKIMAWAKAKTAIVVGVSVLLAAGTATVAFKVSQNHLKYAWRVNGITAKEQGMLEKWPEQVWIEPAKDPRAGNQFAKSAGGNLMGRNTPISWLVRNAYGMTQPWIVMPDDIKDDHGFDFMATFHNNSAAALQAEIHTKLGVVVRRELRETNILILKIGKSGVHGLLPPTPNPTATMRFGGGRVTWFAEPLSTMKTLLEVTLQTPILDKTGLDQNEKYNISIPWEEQWGFYRCDDPEQLKKNVLDSLGLELLPSHEPVEMLVVEKVK